MEESLEEYMHNAMAASLFEGAGEKPSAAEMLAEDAAQRNMSSDLEQSVDFNDEKVVASLEDPALVAHMASARARCKEQLEAEKKISETVVNLAFTEAMGQLSGLTANFRENIQPLEQGSTEVFILLKHLSAARAGKPMAPHFSDVKAPPNLSSSASAYIESIVGPVLKCLADSTAKLNKAIDTHHALNKKLSNTHHKVASSFGQMTQLLREKDKLISSLREVVDSSAALFDHDEVMEAKKRIEILQFLNKSSRAKAPPPGADAPAVGAADTGASAPAAAESSAAESSAAESSVAESSAVPVASESS